MPLPTVEAYDFCSVYSFEEAGEPLYATATRADIWIALEYTGSWESRAFPASDLSDAVKEHITLFAENQGNTRVQFIARAGRYEPEPIHFFVAISHAARPRLYAFTLNDYDDLLEIDLTALANDSSEYSTHLTDRRLFFVCNNGRRDACCAKFGIPVHAAMEAVAGEDVWKSTHIGGHRLAPNLLFLPDALSYGRVQPEDAPLLVENYRQNQIYLPRFRGRTIYDQPIQAAEHFVRQETGIVRVDAFQITGVESEGDGLWNITVRYRESDTLYQVRVEARRYPELVYKTCNSEEPSPVEHYYLVDIVVG